MDLLSIFSSKVSETTTYKPETEAEAFVTLMHICMVADDDSSTAEIKATVNAVQSKRMFAHYDTQSLFKLAITNYEREGGSALLQPCLDAISTDNRKMVFVHCANVVLSDGVLSANEAGALQKMAENFGIEASFAQSVMDVLIEKNKGNIIS